MDPLCQRILWSLLPLPSITNCAISGREADFFFADVLIETANIGISKRAIRNVHNSF